MPNLPEARREILGGVGLLERRWDRAALQARVAGLLGGVPQSCLGPYHGKKQVSRLSVIGELFF